MRRAGLYAILVAMLCAFAYPRVQADGDPAAAEQLVNEFFARYVQKDLDRFMSLWSKQSPDYASRGQTMKELFAETDDLQLKSLHVATKNIEPTKAMFFVQAELFGIEKKTGKPDPSFGKLARVLDLVVEDHVWKVWRYRPSEDWLAEGLISASTSEERSRLMRERPELVNTNLIQVLNKRLSDATRVRDVATSTKVADLALEMAAIVNDKQGLARVHLLRGLLHQSQSQYPAAIDSYQLALNLFRDPEVKNKDGEANALEDIGLVFQATGKYQEALNQFQSALLVRRAMGDDGDEAVDHINIGNIYRDTGKSAEALIEFETAIKLARARGAKRMEVQGRIGIGLLDLQKRLSTCA